MNDAESTICLCMIVRDDAAVIERCLASVRGVIDTWVICDTGSTDATQDVVRRELTDVPGELHERQWRNFGANRTELMALARGRADYLLLLDPDMTLEQRSPLGQLTAGSYLVRESFPDAAFEVRNKRLVRGDLEWRYVGATHEYIEAADGPETVEELDAIVVVHHADQERWMRKLEGDLELLTTQVAASPNDGRAQFYLAQTCRDLGFRRDNKHMLANALDHYQLRAEMPGWDEETYFAEYQVGVLAERLGDWPRAMDAFTRAWESRPERLEALHGLIAGLRERGLYHAAHRFARTAANLRPLPVPNDLLYVEPWVYEWGLLFEYSITSYWVGEYRNSASASQRLLSIKSLPDEHRRQTRHNLKLAIQENDRARAQSPRRGRKLKHVGTPTRGRASYPVAPGLDARLAPRLAEVTGMPVADVEQHLLKEGRPVVLTVPALDLAVRVRPGTGDLLALLDACEKHDDLPEPQLEDPALIVDVGAGIGLTALRLARVYPSARVVAVEPDPGAFEVCIENLKALESRATAVEAAIGDHDEPDNASFETMSLDTLLDQVVPTEPVDFLRLNCGTALPGVLRAGGQWPTRVGSLKVAIGDGPGAPEAIADLHRLGYATESPRGGWVAGAAELGSGRRAGAATAGDGHR